MIYKRIISLALLSTFCVSLSVVSLSALAKSTAPKCESFKKYKFSYISKSRSTGLWTAYYTGRSGSIKGWAAQIEMSVSNKSSADKVRKIYVYSESKSSGHAKKVPIDADEYQWLCSSSHGNYTVGSGVTNAFTYSYIMQNKN